MNMFKDLSMEFLWKSTFVVLEWFYKNFMIFMIFGCLWGPYCFICGSGKQTKSKNCFLTIISWTWKCLFIPQVLLYLPKWVIYDQLFLGCFWVPKAPHRYTHITNPFKLSRMFLGLWVGCLKQFEISKFLNFVVLATKP